MSYFTQVKRILENINGNDVDIGTPTEAKSNSVVKSLKENNPETDV
ncbi:hypothetical protein A2U01_0096123, partial [Trifolium medium]|nr:hypothetical protein [Trifolium medium]